MKKILCFVVAALLVASFGYADSPQSENTVNWSRFGGPTGVTPPTVVMKVRYCFMPEDPGANVQTKLSSGDVVAWSTTSADAYSVSAATTEGPNIAGVLVTDVMTADDNVIRNNGDNVGWIAVKGYALAKIDTSASTAGESLVLTGPGDLDGVGFMTTTEPLSRDVGVLLKDSGSDTQLAPAWLN